VNKMDLIGFERAAFEAVAREFPEADVIPLSALHGDNVVERSPRTPWYEGPPLLEWLEELELAADRNLADLRFPVQWVIRPMSEEHHDYRGYAGQVASGVVRPGDEVLVLPSGMETKVAVIETADGELGEAFPPLSVTLRLEDELDVSRGDLIARPHDAPAPARELRATVCWMHERPLRPGARYRVKHTTRTAPARIDAIEGRLRVDGGGREQADELRLNDIGEVRLRLGQPLLADSYERNRVTGSFILIDEATNDTAGAGMVA
jgi:sulfate adenylyltransferase subunit 1 (EFTu-like GTPase family)